MAFWKDLRWSFDDLKRKRWENSQKPLNEIHRVQQKVFSKKKKTTNGHWNYKRPMEGLRTVWKRGLYFSIKLCACICTLKKLVKWHQTKFKKAGKKEEKQCCKGLTSWRTHACTYKTTNGLWSDLWRFEKEACVFPLNCVLASVL